MCECECEQRTDTVAKASSSGSLAMVSLAASSASRGTHARRPVHLSVAKGTRALSAAASLAKKPKKTASKKTATTSAEAAKVVNVAPVVPNVAANTLPSEARAETAAASAENESSRLREQLLHVLVDHQRQEEEIVALRALARSLKDEVEQIHRQSRVSLAAPPAAGGSDPIGSEKRRPHEFFKLDLQLEQLRAENARLRDELCDANDELERLRAHVQQEVPQLKIAAVKAHAELECVTSQLRDEQAHCDRLESQIARLQARQRGDQSKEAHSSQQKRDFVNQHTDRAHRNSERKSAVEREWDREREAFLLECRRRQQGVETKEKNTFDAVGGEDKENSVGANHYSDMCDAVPSASPRLSRVSLLASSSSSRTRSELGQSRHERRLSSSLSSSQVHRDLSGLDRELRELNAALDKIGSESSQ